MHYFQYQNKELFAEAVPLTTIATQCGTPCYVYSKKAIMENWQSFEKALTGIPHQICYAVKANSNLSILKLLASLDAGFDIVSLGELERVLAAGGNAKKMVFSGVAKKSHEIKRALEVGIYCFNVESESELQRITSVAKELNTVAAIAFRVNPNIDANTHPYIATGLKENKFGIEIEKIPALCHNLANNPHLKLVGIACHIGSQLTTLDPVIEAIDALLELISQLKKAGISLEHINIGGGLGVCYKDETPPSISDYISAVTQRLANQPFKIIFEPGRIIVANAGILLTQVEFIKETAHCNFAIVDAAMNDLMRPALYNAWQNIMPVSLISTAPEKKYDIVGPVCESADFLGKERKLSIKEGDFLAISDTGAYGFSMSSNYNSRPRIAEVLVDENTYDIIRRRETIMELFAQEIK